ncbi:MAG: HigA family addiction module antidote protein [Treponema sp.]|jgi:addiction module HigA family antidote|nr:HigA family addiction module antidote protein [Treponema sp.]
MAKQSLSDPSVVLKNLMENYGLNPSRVAEAVKLNQTTFRLILSGKGKISCPVALRFAKFFGKTPEYWLNLQNQYDISESAKDKELTAVLKSIKKAEKAVLAKKDAKNAAQKKKSAAKKDAAGDKKAGKSAAGARKTSKAAGDKIKTPAAKKSALKKPVINKKAAGAKSAGARRTRKPKAASAVSAFKPDTTASVDAGGFTPGRDHGSFFREKHPAKNTSEDFSGFSFPETPKSGKDSE